MIKLTIISAVLLTASIAIGQHAIKYEEINGRYWITPAGDSRVFGIKPAIENPPVNCDETIDFLESNEVLKGCKNDFSSCNTDYLLTTGRKRAFGKNFKHSGEPSEASKVDWDIEPIETSALDPRLIQEYAEQLGIDYRKAVVSSVDGSALARNVTYSLPLLFSQYESGKPGGNSWFFQTMVGMLTDKEASDTYLRPPTRSAKAIQLSSMFLNCELKRHQTEHVFVGFNYTINGMRNIDKKDQEEIYKAYLQLKNMEFPPTYSELDKALLYGAELARLLDKSTIEAIGLKNLANRIFDSKENKINLRNYGNPVDLSKELSLVDQHYKEAAYIKLVPIAEER